MIYVNHTTRRMSRRQAAELAAAHVAGVIQRLGTAHASLILADTLPHWTAESYEKAAQPDQHTNLIAHFEQRITAIQQDTTQ